MLGLLNPSIFFISLFYLIRSKILHVTLYAVFLNVSIICWILASWDGCVSHSTKILAVAINQPIIASGLVNFAATISARFSISQHSAFGNLLKIFLLQQNHINRPVYRIPRCYPRKACLQHRDYRH